MIGLLTVIVNQMVCWVRTGVTDVINSVVFALGALIGGLLSLMPTIPTAPDLPAPMVTALSWIAWFFPVGTLLDILSFLALAWITWMGVSLVLRWARAVS